MASILFLDIQAAFPNTVKERLLHNMKTRCVPLVYTCLVDNMLSNRHTQIHFNDYTSEPIAINNGTTQGCPLLMIFYAFYNANLVNIARGKQELTTGFIDDCVFVATGDSLTETHQLLKKDQAVALTGPTPTTPHLSYPSSPSWTLYTPTPPPFFYITTHSDNDIPTSN